MSRGSLTVLLMLLTAALLVVGIGVVPAAAGESDVCIDCHGNPDNVHGELSHTAVPGSGLVALFADRGHDSSVWNNPSPQYAVSVSCSTCHNNDLPLVHGNDCWTCHPTPYNTLGIWNKGCQQGGCHSFIHADVAEAHDPFSDTSDSDNDCYRCHADSGAFVVPDTKCLTCHASYGSGDVTPPVTTSDAQAVYYGPARIKFSITDNGKVGIGRTFYRLDGGPTTASSEVLVAEFAPHVLEYWSVDQSGNTESAINTKFFTIEQDATPPTTTSNAQGSYYNGATITLTATDSSTLGVKTTYFRLNGGPIQAGTKVIIPPTNGTFTYTLAFWSEDWAGNVEAAKSVTFTVTSGTATLVLVWGSSDTSGSPCPGDPEANAAWRIGRVGSGAIVATGSAGCPNWDGVDEVTVTIGSTYFVSIDWWDSVGGYDDNTNFPSVPVTTPGEVIRLSY